MIAEDFRTFLISDTALGGLIGSRVHPLMLPQAPTVPALTYQTVSTLPMHTLQQASALQRIRMQIDVWAKTYLDVETVATALNTCLDGFRGVMGGSPGLHVQGAFRAMERDWYDEAPQLYRRTIDYFLWVQA